MKEIFKFHAGKNKDVIDVNRNIKLTKLTPEQMKSETDQQMLNDL